jgi:hypothetical protein
LSIRCCLAGGLAVIVLSGCGSVEPSRSGAGIPRALLLEARPIGRGTRFHSPVTGAVVGSCSRRIGPRYGVHVEMFAANRVVIVPTGIGTRPPRRFSAGRIAGAGCYGDLVTLEPTGVVLLRPGRALRLAELFKAWGQRLSQHRLTGFSAPPRGHVLVFVNGTRRPGPPGRLTLTRHAEIVLEVGPYVPPHRRYTFPPGT